MNSVPALFLHRCGFCWDLMRRFAEIAITCALLIITAPLMAWSRSPSMRQRRIGIRAGAADLSGPALHAPQVSHQDTPPEKSDAGMAAHYDYGRGGLRYTRIDFLPRLINVLRGEICLRDDGTSLFWD